MHLQWTCSLLDVKEQTNRLREHSRAGFAIGRSSKMIDNEICIMSRSVEANCVELNSCLLVACWSSRNKRFVDDTILLV